MDDKTSHVVNIWQGGDRNDLLKQETFKTHDEAQEFVRRYNNTHWHAQAELKDN